MACPRRLTSAATSCTPGPSHVVNPRNVLRPQQIGHLKRARRSQNSRVPILPPPLQPATPNLNSHPAFPNYLLRQPATTLAASRYYSVSTRPKMASATSFYDFKPLDKRGQEHPLSEYKGKVVLIVNTASKCGFTPQYAGLEALYKKLKEQHADDFTILGFPCNQFGGQEPGTDDDVQSFCQVNYGVSFPIMKKTEVNGDGAEPLFTWLKTEKPGIMGLKMVKWNFEKFLIGRDGKVKGRWASTTKPEALEQPILDELNKPKA